MSETIENLNPPSAPEVEPVAAPEVKTPTPEEIQAAKDAADKLAKDTAAKALADKIAARVAELKTYEGKTFKPNSGNGLPVKVLKYIGILADGKGGSYYAFTVEIAGHARWNPSATDFLNQYTVIDSPAETAVNSEPK